MSLVTVEYVQARPGLSGVAEATLEALIEDASNLVRLAAGGVLDDVDAAGLDTAIGTTGAGVIRAILVNMVRRAATNPRGAGQETLGDYSYSMGGEGGGPATVYLFRSEERRVRRAVGITVPAAVQMDGYLPTQPSEERVSVSATADTWAAVTAE